MKNDKMQKGVRTFSSNKIVIIFMSIGIFLLFVIGVSVCFSLAIDQIVINEVCSSNFSAYPGDWEQYPDYIELYNPTDVPVSLDGYSLSDSEINLEKADLSGITIAPKDYVIVYADGVNVPEHAQFKISDVGEKIYLSNNWGEIIDSVDIPSLDYNTSYARVYDGSEVWERRTPTPKKSNIEAETIIVSNLDAPIFSHESGFYEDSFELVLEAEKGMQIYYTLDGSEPTEDSILYEQPVWIDDATINQNKLSARDDLSPSKNSIPNYNVDKATIVRAIAYDVERNLKSESETRTYFVNFEEKNEYAGLPIISIVTDPDNLFGFEKGIYGNGKKYQDYIDNGGIKDGNVLEMYKDVDGRINYLYMASNAFNEGKEWEREAHMTYFDSQHEFESEQNIGIRISGQSTRTYPQKSFKLYARDIYDPQSTFNFEWNGEKREWTSVKLRNGGSDCSGSRLKDPISHKISQGRNIAIQDFTPYILFLNGEYWGIYSMRERYNEEYFQKYYNVRENELWMIDAGNAKIGGGNALEDYSKLLHFSEEADFTKKEEYDIFCERMDIQSLIDFYCINIYIGNTDATFRGNSALWRTAIISNKEYYDGKWRWMMYDVDISMADYTENSFDESINQLMEESMIKNLLRNADFKKQFCTSFMDIANDNLNKKYVIPELQKWLDVYKEQVVKTLRQFQNVDFDGGEYDEASQDVLEFFEYRFEYITSYMEEILDLKGVQAEVLVKSSLPEGGSIIINTVEISDEKEWSGRYYTDYPITVTAVADEGYKFVGWKGDIDSEEEHVVLNVPEDGIEVEAIFEKEGEE